jgi:tryptophan synthase alpha chain
MANRIDDKFSELKKGGAKAFMPFISAGDPDLETSIALVEEAEKAGASLVEIGIPFSDPIADGPVIQDSFTRALRKNLTIEDVFRMVKESRQRISIPLVAMLSYSIVYRFGPEQFVARAKRDGFDGAIIPDLPMEESSEIRRVARKRDFKLISLVAPNTPAARRKRLVSMASGFVYYMSVVGITGVRDSLPPQIARDVRELKGLTPLPVCVGFGVKGPAQARMVARLADGVIVGSAIVRIVERCARNKRKLLKEAGRLMSSIAKAVSG